jgi:hypothetical protein
MEEKGVGVLEWEKKRMQIIRMLGNIISARKDNGRLQDVSLGWYPTTVSSIMYDKNERWNFEWIRIL